MRRMNKALALSFIGGTPKRAAAAVGITSSAVSQWPDELPDGLEDRVLAAWTRKHIKNIPEPFKRSELPKSEVSHA